MFLELDDKRDPLGFAKRTIEVYGQTFKHFIAAPNTVVAIIVAFIFMLSFAVAVAMLDRYRSNILVQDRVREDLEIERVITNIPKEDEKEKGNPGNAKGDGGGAKLKREKPNGGGGKENESKPTSHGKIAQGAEQQIIPPTPDPPRMSKPSLPTPVTNKADAILFPTDNRDMPYGSPNSKSTDPSAGQGKGSGMGGGDGSGQGTGQGSGVGPGWGENTGGGDPTYDGGEGTGNGTDYTRIFTGKDVQQKAVITFKPQPEYTEEARKNQIQGVVRVSMVLSANGTVQSVRAISNLPYGLTEKALQAAKRVQFTPAKKDGRNVSQWVTVEYNSRIY